MLYFFLNFSLFLSLYVALQQKRLYNALQQDKLNLFISTLDRSITMQNFTENMNEQFKTFSDLQAKSLEPMRIFASLSADAAEKFARHSHAVAGDVLDFAAKSANLPLAGDNIQDVTAAQAAEVSTFTELMNTRATEYSEMAQSFASQAKEAAESATSSFK